MADVYVDVGEMTHSTDTNKVPLQYRDVAKKTMRAAVLAGLKGVPGFTTEQGSNTVGFQINLTLSELTFAPVQGRPGVSCQLNGSIDGWPKRLITTSTLVGSAKVGAGGKNVTDGDVKFCIEEAIKRTMRDSIIPTLKKLPTPTP